jgi:hypothetical protein
MAAEKKSIALEGLAGILILVFVYTALAKLVTFPRYVAVLRQVNLFRTASVFIAATVLFAEFFIAGLLFLPVTRRLGFLFASVLMAVFTGYVIYLLVAVQNLPCPCGGLLEKLTWPQHLVFNSSLTCLSFIGWYFSKEHKRFIAINRGRRKTVTE